MLQGCKKDWLDKKPDISLVVPTTLTDLQALLDNTLQAFNSGNCMLGEFACDDYYVTPTTYRTLASLARNSYIWADTIYSPGTGTGWVKQYTQIFYANVVLDRLKSITTGQGNNQYNAVKGSALFYRAFAYFDLVQVYAKPYTSNTKNDLGLPLNILPIVDQKLPRSTLEDTYQLILDDLEASALALPTTASYKTQPTKPAAYALLARVYLSMQKYTQAYSAADSALTLYNTLLDYNNLDTTASVPIPENNDEIIYANKLADATFGPGKAICDSNLYSMYQSEDLRKAVYFKRNASGGPYIYGRYSGSSSTALFDGMAVDEVYLVRAECAARLGKIQPAMNDLNTLLKTRWKAGAFQNLTADNADTALAIILRERRKELCFRGLRWGDLRRLNMDNRFTVTLTRDIDGIKYTLLPNSDRYVFPIPPLETDYNPNVVQNPR